MRKMKIRITILLVCVMCFVIVRDSVISEALDFAEIKDIIKSYSDNSIMISEYNTSDNTYLDIDSISLESAIENSCDNNIDAVSEQQTTGAITQIVTDDVEQQYNDNSSLYYIGEADQTGMLIDSNDDVLASSSTDAVNDYYVEDWHDLPGDLSIEVNKQASCVTVFKGDVPIRAMVCSAGESTPEGTFYMQSQWDWLMLIKGQYGRYCSQISGDYLFHSVPYNSMDIYDLDTEMYNQLGTLCSHGCIRLTVEDAKWIYDNCSAGVEITIYNDSNPGPLGKPSIEQIPDDQTWDPTDEDIQ